jgi:ankyrin repeat protein
MLKTRFLVALALPLAVGVAAAQSPIADAAMKGDLAKVRTLIAAPGAKVSQAQGDGMTALHWAADRGDTAMVSVLLKAKASLTATTRINTYTPLHIAAKGGHGDVMVALLNAGADPKATTSTGVTALHLASGSGAVDGVNALLDKGADPNARDPELGQTPLVFAAAGNRPLAISTLIKRGADPSLKTRMLNLTEETAQDQAGTRRRNEVLISFETKPAPAGGADVPAPAPVMTMQSLGFAYLVPGLEAQLAADAAANGGRGGRGGPQPKGPFTATQIQQAIAAGREVQKSKVSANGPVREEVDTLNGGIAGFLGSVGGIGGLTALHHAVRQGNIEAVDALIAGGAKVNTPNDVDGTTPLLMATINGQFDVAMRLVKAGADPNLTASSGLAPLYATINTMWSPRSRFPQPQAVQNQKTTHIELMDALVKAGAKVNQRLTSQFWYFAYNNCGNANCGLENITGTTPFWRAAYSLDVEAMKLLVKAGADPNLPSTPPAGGRGGRGGGGGGAPGAVPAGAGVDPLIPAAGAAAAAGAPAGGGGGGGGAGRGGAAGGPVLGQPANGFTGAVDAATDSAARAVPPGIGVYAVHAVAGVGYGNGFAGNAHRHAPEAWMAAMKYVVEELHADVNMRDNGGYTPLHHAAARGDNVMIEYLVSKGADVRAVARNGRTTVDMANGPVSRITPIPETIALLEKLGAKNSHRCASCW